ncbi:hypothetical protein O6H91_12G012500 [Diphasiastrum complanatum]|uniref:Uncharacterized protein n=1 Tax=Diphasiastrum complanatum TaxID=34168 RepID=A0ACC2BYY0_DIPCM|nr:hypothetical protein O6H91_12G012500 [Diphasiastrum complanatum]
MHPVRVLLAEARPPPRVRMKEWQGMPATVGRLTLRLGQFSFAVISFTISISNFSTVTAFWYVFLLIPFSI